MSILKAIWWVIKLPFKILFGKTANHQNSGPVLDQSFVTAKWQEIEQLMRLGHPSNYARAILEADKLLDHILKAYRAPGMTMGDRLKSSRNRFSYDGYNAAWQGHKIRNELVHNSQFQILDFTAKSAINNFKKAIDELI